VNSASVEPYDSITESIDCRRRGLLRKIDRGGKGSGRQFGRQRRDYITASYPCQLATNRVWHASMRVKNLRSKFCSDGVC